MAFTVSRNTSTGVEKTTGDELKYAGDEKHLHGRGEDARNTWAVAQWIETPPRAWRRLKDVIARCRDRGNTSTGVEKTFVSRSGN